MTQSHIGSTHAEHLVLFYDDEADLVRSVSTFLSEGADLGEPSLVIATDDHRRAFRTRTGASATLIERDARETLDAFMVDGAPDPARFDGVVGDLVRVAVAAGTRARAYGEMVALLWEDGNVTGALRLEELWNSLLSAVDVSLLCAYPTAIIAEDQSDPLDEVRRLHSAVVDVRPEFDIRQTFGASSRAASEARHLVVESLERFGYGTIADDAAILITELATNALRHVGSPFTATLSVDGRRIRVAVEDASQARPVLRAVGAEETTGRGLHLIEALADRWGVESTAAGKLVWAELDTPRA